ncbi:hypothetical protein AAG906_020787 [Vitis piasezkii]
MATPSQSQSSGGGEDDFKWRQAIEKSVGKREATKSSPPEIETKRRKAATHSASTSGLLVAVQEASGKLEAEPNRYTRVRSSQEHTTQGLMNHIHPCLELPVRKAQIPLIFQQKDNVTKNHSCQAQCAQD